MPDERYGRDHDHEAVFTTYANYFGSLADSLRGEFGLPPWNGVIETMSTLQAVQNIRRRPPPAPQDLFASLRLGWSLEFQVHLTGQMIDEALPYLLPGTFTNAYYAVYHLMRAFFLASNQHVTPRHSSALRVIANEVARGVFPAPLGVMCTGTQNDRDSFDQLPVEAELPIHHNLARPNFEARWTILCRLLRTTRQREVDRLYQHHLSDLRRKSPRRRRLSPGSREQIDRALRPTTLFDVFRRMRERSHYRDADAFLHGTTAVEARTVYEDVGDFLTATMAALEVMVARYRGLDTLATAAGPLEQADDLGIFDEGIGLRLSSHR